ncbi:MAG: hypothetical protein ABGW97_08685 [Christiangramia sp.]|uniref:hypothetical protein n=1 Tax=Christiangramia sp. TaxID=1931228 RepID=UPI003242076F
MNENFERYFKEGNEIFNQIHDQNYSSKEYGIILFYLLQRFYNHGDFLLAEWPIHNEKFYDSVSLIQKFYHGRNPSYFKSLLRNLKGISKNEKQTSKYLIIVVLCNYILFRIKNFKQRIKIRNRIKAVKITDPRLALLWNNFPVIFAEDLRFYKAFQFRNNKPINPYKLKDYFAIIYSNKIPKNENIRFSQHGGFYGEIRSTSGHEFEYFLSDEFYTWGWSYCSKHIPYYSERLLKFKNEYRDIEVKKKDQILILPPPMLENYYNFYEDLQNSGQIRDYDIIVKGYGKRLTFSKDLDKFWNALQNCQFLVVEGDMKKFLKESNLAMIGYFPSTAFLETISVNTPTVAIQSISEDEFSPEYIEYVYKFKEVGILHTNLESAFDYINSIEDISVWWEEIKITHWFQNYLDTYCNTKIKDV